ncbi:MAG: arylamine N-acetyltransferase [Lachnospiraceae bacterium]|nr:arylamine N-acetyltransferase [Lachnospiraceae bacterium]
MNETEKKAYLDRMGFSGQVTLDEDCLERLIRAHLEHVPFENLDGFDFKLVPEISEEALLEKVVHQRRGGYCFELNMLFGHLLGAVGFSWYPVAARVVFNKPSLPPTAHMGLVVKLGEKRSFVDVGYGGPGPKGLLPLEPGVWQVNKEEFQVRQIEEGDFCIDRQQEGEWKSLLQFQDLPVREVDFQLLNFYCAKCPQILFTQKRIINLCTPDGSKALTDKELTIRTKEGVTRRTCESREELETALREEFGICVSLP